MSTPMTSREKDWIDNADLEALLYRWRFAKFGDSMLNGETGKYFSQVMFAKRDQDPQAWTLASKSVGWEE